VIVDGHPFGGHFGQISQDVQSSYNAGDTATVVFFGANPRNSIASIAAPLTF
jgi:hypothetical protein